MSIRNGNSPRHGHRRRALIAIATAVAMFVPLAKPVARAAQQPGQVQPSPHEAEASEDAPPPFAAEFVASTIFQEATAIAKLRSRLSLDLHYFGVDDNDIGIVGLSWTLTGHGVQVAPGLGWSFGRDNRPAPVVTARWAYERPRWVTEGLWVQSLRAHLPEPASDAGAEESAEDVRYAGVLDGVHVSARIGRAEIGPLVEHIRYREEREWKGGARFAWLVSRGLRVVAQVLGPGAEVRGGLAWAP